LSFLGEGPFMVVTAYLLDPPITRFCPFKGFFSKNVI